MPWFTENNPTRDDLDTVVQVIAHEAGHDMWRRVMNERQRADWTALVTQQAPIDYDALLAAFDAFAETEPIGTITPTMTVGRLRSFLYATNEPLAIQVDVASSVYDPDYTKKGNATAWRWMNPDAHKDDPRPLLWYTRNEVKALRDKQDQRKVPLFPITGYAATNPEEAWCDAFGNLMAYGPRKVLEPIRDLIYRMFPAIRRNPDTDVDTDT
jgi:hypothetical protein